MSKIMVDPPGGWRYGFPKPASKKNLATRKNFHKWLLKNGYPKDDIHLVDVIGCRMWREK